MSSQERHPPFAVYLFGPPRVERGTTLVSGFESRKALALLCYLISERKPVSRERLLALFWPDKTPARGRGNLSRVLTNLNTLLPGHLSIDRHHLAFRPPPTTLVDLYQFQVLRESDALEDLQQAAALLTGEFLEGLSLPESGEFDLWLTFEREYWHQEQVHLLDLLVRRFSDRGDYEQALHYARRLLHLDPWREEAHRQVMELLARTGQRSAAIAQYGRCCKFLRRELDALPTPQTQALYQRIRTLLPTYPHNVPPPAGPLLGREEEMALLTRWLADPRVRLITITGPGGVGKTRLAHQLLIERGSTFLQGGCNVSLDNLATPDHVIPALAQALQLRFHGRASPEAQLLSYLEDKEILLLLDSFEHVFPARGFLVRLLERAPLVTVLVTSRQRLNLRQEWVYPLQELPLPEPSPAAIRANPAVRLFLFWARRYRDWTPTTPEDWDRIAHIVRLVRGLPLAVELVATWLSTHTLAEIVTALEQGITDLTTTQEDMPPRHRSLRATFDYSWRLLDPEAQQVLTALAVFQGAFAEEAACTVARASRHTLHRLVDHSLVRRDAQGRYLLPDPIRPFVAEALAAAPTLAAAVAERHARFYAASLQRAVPRLTGPAPHQALAEIQALETHLHQAWQWAVETGDVAVLDHMWRGLYLYFDLRSDYHQGLNTFAFATAALMSDAPQEEAVLARLWTAQGFFALRLGRHDQAAELLQKALTLAQQSRAPEDQARALRHLGYLAWAQSEYARARRYLQRSLTLYRHLRNVRGEALAMNQLGFVAIEEGHYHEALTLLQAALQRFQEAEDTVGQARALNNLGIVCVNLGRYPEAKQYYQQSLAIRRQLHDRRGEALCLNNLGNALKDTGDIRQARDCFERSLRLFRLVGDRRGEAFVLNNLGQLAVREGQFAEARQHLEASLAIKERLGDRRGMGNTLNNLGYLMECQAAWDAAYAHYRRALHLGQEIAAEPIVAEALVGIARVLAVRGKVEEATALATYALRRTATPDNVRERAERLLADLSPQGVPPGQGADFERMTVQKWLGTPPR